jgi:predicted  nucleic acid-binding Zn-ribbon protein
MDKDDEEDIVFIDIKDSIKDNEENNLKQRKINTLQIENNTLKYQIEDLQSELQRVKDPQMDLFDELTITVTDLYNYITIKVSEIFICF